MSFGGFGQSSFQLGTQAGTTIAGAQKSVSFALPTATTTATTGGSTPGFNFGTKPAATTTSSVAPGFSFGASTGTSTTTLNPTTTTASGLNFGGFGGTPATTTAASTGFALAVPPGTTGTAGLFAKPVAPTTTTQQKPISLFNTPTTQQKPISLFGNLSNVSTVQNLTFGTTTNTTSALTSATNTTLKVGLGGLDPKTTSANTGAASGDGKTSGTKSAKEEQVPAELVKDIDSFKTFLKDQKDVREKIARVSSREISGIQEEVNNLRKMLAVVSNGVQRSAVAVEKLKTESAMELKNAEIAQRTKDTPPGLQYENVAPTVYFHRLVEEFEVRMTIYRQQIEEMESYLVALHQPGLFTPQELNQVLKKLHETFLGLAAQLHGVHEAVKAQKDQYLNYRKAIHGDTTNIFETRKKVAEKTKSSRSLATSTGPTPFAGLTNAAAAALALSVQRPPQPQAQTQQAPAFGSGLSTTGLFNANPSAGGFSFGTAKPLG